LSEAIWKGFARQASGDAFMGGWRKSCRIVLWVVLIYAVSEAGFRIYQFAQLTSQAAKYTHYSFTSFQSPIFVLDVHTGFAYRPHSHNHLWFYDSTNKLLTRGSNVVTNNFGMIGSDDVTMEKPKEEYRIAVLGDSFCATTPSDVTWPAELQKISNHDEYLKHLTGKSVIKVLNFALDGTATVQYPDAYKYKAAKFNPDLVIVNFVSGHISPQYSYRDTLRVGEGDYAMFSCATLPVDIQNINCSNGSSFVIDPGQQDYSVRASRIKAEIYAALVRRLPWFSAYPELLARILEDRFGLHSRLEISPHSNAHHASPDEAVAASVSALKAICSMHPRTMIFVHPTLDQCLSRETPAIVTQLLQKSKGLTIIYMLDKLPVGASEEEIRKWYNSPPDIHPSNYGAEVYAQAVEKQASAFVRGSQ
jgi:hypothetical protein